MKDQIWNIFREKDKLYPKNKINDFRKQYLIEKGKNILKLELNNKIKNKEANKFIANIRIGNIKTTNGLVRLKLINDNYFNKCIHRKLKEDHIKHWVLEFKELSDIRDEYLNEILLIYLKKEDYQTAFISHILKGKYEHKVPKKYLNKIKKFIKKMISIIENKIKELYLNSNTNWEEKKNKKHNN